MTIRFSQPAPKPARQRGAATLLVVLVLLIAMSMIAVTTMRSGMVEQQIAGNDVRAREAQEAAEAGLEYGVAWARKNNIPWPTSGDESTLSCPATGCPTSPDIPSTGTSTGETYNINPLIYSRPLNLTSNFIRVTSTAIGSNDSIAATSEVWIKQLGLTNNGKIPPPMVMNGCMTSTTGTPNIYPAWNDIDVDGVEDPNEWNDLNGNGTVDTGEWADNNSNGVVDNEIGNSIMTSQPKYDASGTFCLDYCGGGTCHLDVNNGSLQNNVAFPNGSIWNYYFDVSQAQFKDSASTTLSTAGGPYWITSTGNWSAGTYGSAIDPVAIVFVNGCPKPSGNTTIYGILFFLENNGCVTNPMNGWGSVTVYGSIAANGGVNKLNANINVYGVRSPGAGAMKNINLKPTDAVRIPGTWKDFY